MITMLLPYCLIATGKAHCIVLKDMKQGMSYGIE
jgi:hypothetical protein